MDDMRRRMHLLEAQALLHISMLGDLIAERECYDVDGLEAIAFFLFETYGVKPVQVGLLSADTLRLLLNKEMKGWTVPPKSRGVTVPPDGQAETVLQARLGLYRAKAELDYHAELFGNVLARRDGYGVDGREALELYLCRELGYPPGDVGSWSYETIRELLVPKMAGWEPGTEG